MDELAPVRQAFMDHGLDEGDMDADPVAQFDRWFRQVSDAGVYQPDAMVVASVAPDGAPSTRMVLLRGFDERGFRFFTDGGSQKAVELDANPSTSLLFPWNVVSRQVRIIGVASRLSSEDVDAYFAERPRGSQVATVASHQSRSIADRPALDRLYRQAEAELGTGPIARPDRWTGYLVVPHGFEFWQGRDFRFHDRLRYTLGPGGWTIDRLQP